MKNKTYENAVTVDTVHTHTHMVYLKEIMKF